MSSSNRKDGSVSYATAGVDIDAGEALVEAIGPLAKSTQRAGTQAGLGGFGALFDLKAAGYNDPILVSSTDGVGTKLKIALAANKHDTIGIDLVAMCVNDLVVQGAEPLFFLDYFATGKLDVDTATAVVAGIAEGCRQAGCALIGGETAEMPGVYQNADYDLAGFTVGAAERGGLIDGRNIAPGDVILGLASSGVHSNGYSLVRHLVEKSGLKYSDTAPFGEGSLGDALLTPTRIYVKSCLAAVKTGQVKGMAHITGGGLLDNVPRVMPEGTMAVLNADKWPLPPVFQWLAEQGNMSPFELLRTFNCGIGMVLIVAPDTVDEVVSALGEEVFTIGQIAPHNGEAIVEVTGSGWGYNAPWRAETKH